VKGCTSKRPARVTPPVVSRVYLTSDTCMVRMPGFMALLLLQCACHAVAGAVTGADCLSVASTGCMWPCTTCVERAACQKERCLHVNALPTHSQQLGAAKACIVQLLLCSLVLGAVGKAVT
jgi:hypothetical protein